MDTQAFSILFLGSAGVAATLPLLGYGIALFLLACVGYLGADILTPDYAPEAWVPEHRAFDRPSIGPLPTARQLLRARTAPVRCYPVPVFQAPRAPSGRFERPVDTYECAALAAPYLAVPTVL